MIPGKLVNISACWQKSSGETTLQMFHKSIIITLVFCLAWSRMWGDLLYSYRGLLNTCLPWEPLCELMNILLLWVLSLLLLTFHSRWSFLPLCLSTQGYLVIYQCLLVVCFFEALISSVLNLDYFRSRQWVWLSKTYTQWVWKMLTH